jgi:hypothetical protein
LDKRVRDMAKRKQSTITTIIDIAKKACVSDQDINYVSDQDTDNLRGLTDETEPKVLEEILVKATINESEETLAILSSAFDEGILTSALIELAKEGDINGVIKLANSDDLGDPARVLQLALAQAKRDNIPEDVIDILGMVIELELAAEENE